MNRGKRILYISITSFLASIAASACYWQTTKYIDSRKRWSTIAKQLSSQNPKSISQLDQQQRKNLFAFKYIEIKGRLCDESRVIDRPRGVRVGYLVLKKLVYEDKGKSKEIIALQGWCPDNWQLKPTKNEQKQQVLRGILRKKQHKDYLHQKLKSSDLKKYRMNSWIDLQRYIKQLDLTADTINTNYYFEILKPLNQQQQSSQEQQQQHQKQQYPYQYSVDNFELPYLTPDKHRGYAVFWGSTMMVGLWGVIKGFRMK